MRRGLGVAVTEPAGNRRVRMALVVFHRVGQRDAERNRVHAELVDHLDEVAGRIDVVDAEVRREQIERLIVELRAEAAGLAVLVLVIDVLVALDAAAIARFVLHDVRSLLDHGLVQAERRCGSGGHKIHLRHRVHGVERLVVRPGAALAEALRALAACDLLVELQDDRGRLFALGVRRVRDDAHQVLGPHHAAEAAAAAEARLGIAASQLVDGRQRDRRVAHFLVVLAGRPDQREVRLRVALVQRLHACVHLLTGELRCRKKLELGPRGDAQHRRLRGAPREQHLVHIQVAQLRSELAAARGPHRRGLALDRTLEWRVAVEERAQPGHEVGAAQNAEVEDQRCLGRVRVVDAAVHQQLEGARDPAEHVLEIFTLHTLVPDLARGEIDVVAIEREVGNRTAVFGIH